MEKKNNFIMKIRNNNNKSDILLIVSTYWLSQQFKFPTFPECLIKIDVMTRNIKPHDSRDSSISSISSTQPGKWKYSFTITSVKTLDQYLNPHPLV